MKFKQLELFSSNIEEIYRTSHFSLERTIDDQGRGFVDFFVLDPNGFDLVQEMGFGIGEPYVYDIKKYIDKLKRARTEIEKDKILYELYFIFCDVSDGYC